MWRWLAFLMLVGGSAGCAMTDEYDYGPWGCDAPSVVAQQSSCGTGVVPAGFTPSQTPEPPR